MEREEDALAHTKQGDKRPSHSSVTRDASESLVSSPLLEKSVFELNYDFPLVETFDSYDSSSDEVSDLNMAKGSNKNRRKMSNPISIPTVQVKASNSHEEDDQAHSSLCRSPSNSVGDTIYDSPRLPRPSKDFSHVMIKLKGNSDIQRMRSCDDVVVSDSDGESCTSSFPISSSLPVGNLPQRRNGRRTVRFDEATITLTAELGESASRFRSQWRRKKRLTNNHIRFGESRNITVQHEETEEVPSPQLERADKSTSIFGVCSYSSYGRYA